MKPGRSSRMVKLYHLMILIGIDHCAAMKLAVEI